MTRRAAAAAVALAAVAGAVPAAGALAGWWRGGSGDVPLPSLVSAKTDVTPRSALFGDTLTASVDVLVDRRRVDPARVTVAAAFAPYRVSGVPTVTRHAVGPAEQVTFTYRLTCLDDGCLPSRRGYSFRAAEVVAPARDGRRATAQASWPSVGVASRTTEADTAAGAPPWRGGGGDLVPVEWSIGPGLLSALLAAGAVLLAVFGGGVAAYAVRSLRRREAAAPAGGRQPTPLELALAATRRAARGGGAAERRRALELLARVLRRGGRPDLAGAATRLAWSPERPAPPRVEAFADEVARAETEAAS
jgi:hypothetical protein